MPASAWRTPWTVAKPKTPAVAVRWRERRRSRPHPSRRRPNLTRNNPTRAYNPTQPKKHDSEVGPSALRLRENSEFPEWSTKHPLFSLEISGNAKCWGPSLFSFLFSGKPAKAQLTPWVAGAVIGVSHSVGFARGCALDRQTDVAEILVFLISIAKLAAPSSHRS